MMGLRMGGQLRDHADGLLGLMIGGSGAGKKCGHREARVFNGSEDDVSDRRPTSFPLGNGVEAVHRFHESLCTTLEGQFQSGADWLHPRVRVTGYFAECETPSVLIAALDIITGDSSVRSRASQALEIDSAAVCNSLHEGRCSGSGFWGRRR